MTTNYENLLATRERVTREHGGRSESSEDRLFSLQTSISIALTLENFMNCLATLRSSSYSRG